MSESREQIKKKIREEFLMRMGYSGFEGIPIFGSKREQQIFETTRDLTIEIFGGWARRETAKRIFDALWTLETDLKSGEEIFILRLSKRKWKRLKQQFLGKEGGGSP